MMEKRILSYTSLKVLDYDHNVVLYFYISSQTCLFYLFSVTVYILDHIFHTLSHFSKDDYPSARILVVAWADT